MRIPYQQLKAEFERVLTGLNINNTIAGAIATVFADNSRDGVHSHGLNRFPTFIEYIKEGLVFPDAVPTKVNAFGAIEQWEGNLAPGMLNARFCMDRAISLANDNGIGCVAIKNTNHWMRGGTYGQQAADAGYIGLCFTNTIANLPPWGAPNRDWATTRSLLLYPARVEMWCWIWLSRNMHLANYGSTRRKTNRYPFPAVTIQKAI